MKINIFKGFILRSLLTIGILFLPCLILTLIYFFTTKDYIVLYFIFLSYLSILVLSLIIVVIFVNVSKEFEYKYIYFDEYYFSLINKRGSFVDFENFKIYIDNPVLNILLSPIDLIMGDHEIRYDFAVKEKSIEYTRVYLTINQYFRIKKSKFKYVEL